uniref:Undecaprenyl-diphosphatase 3 n=1 Tax=Lygus hesperus TaxID=30085 RepID=A0A0A9YPV4_LYGHE
MIPLYYCNVLSYHYTVGKSRWFVGSSYSSKSGSVYYAQAYATRMRQPPDNFFVGKLIVSSVKCNPDRIVCTIDSALSEFISRNYVFMYSRRCSASHGESY